MSQIPPVPPRSQVTPLSGGPAVTFDGVWPDRVAGTVGRAELHSYGLETPRAMALICVGGGYTKLVYDKEGAEVALWLNDLGIEAHVLVHRLPGAPDGRGGVWPKDIALRDGLAALDRLQVLGGGLPLILVGLSSGGHLAGVLACQSHPVPRAGLIAAYAPLNANHRDHKWPEGKPDFAPAEKQAFYDDWPIGLPEALPPLPMFLAYALGDKTVPVQHALRLIETAAATGADVDAHIFGQAPHGFALRDRGGSHAQWPALAAAWIEARLAP